MKNISGYAKLKRKKKPKDAPEKHNAGKIGLRKKRSCLKCGKAFHSKGPYNRICEKCGILNERIAPCIYSVSESPTVEPSTLEKRFYGLN